MSRVLCAGLGVIGLEIARTAASHEGIELTGAVDVAPDKAGRTLRELVGASAPDLPVWSSLTEALELTDSEAVVLSTTSRLSQLRPQVLEALGGGAAVISTCEELAYPWGRDGVDDIDEQARSVGRAVLGTGVNPGFVMDLLPALLTMPSTRVESVMVERIVDLDRRRDALKWKAGVGMPVAEFEELAAIDGIGHVGLDASAQLLASAVGADHERPVVEILPLTDSNRSVVGFRQRTALGGNGRGPRVELILEMSTGPERERDLIVIEGEPKVRAEIEGGIFGDSATASIIVNAIPRVLEAPPGLHTVLDLPPLRGWRPPLAS